LRIDAESRASQSLFDGTGPIRDHCDNGIERFGSREFGNVCGVTRYQLTSASAAAWRGFIDSELPDRAVTENGHHQTSERSGILNRA
jgi:hypothetical protein